MYLFYNTVWDLRESDNNITLYDVTFSTVEGVLNGGGCVSGGGEWIVIPWLDAAKLLQAKRARKSYLYGA